MTVLRLTAEIPPSRRLVLELPQDTPTGLAQIEVITSGDQEVFELPTPEIDVATIPHYFDSKTGERRPIARSGVVREVRSRE